MNPKNCKLTGIHEPIEVRVNTGVFKWTALQCKWCHHRMLDIGEMIQRGLLQ